jgi:hypothetical protein
VDFTLKPMRGVEVTAGGKRLRFLGDGTVTPKRRVVWRDHVYGLLTFEPGRDRLSPSHPAVVADPLSYEAHPKDIETRSALCTMQERAVKHGGRTRADVSARPRFQLPRSSGRQWRLPSAPRREWRLP